MRDVTTTPTDLVGYGCSWIRDHPREFKTIMHLLHLEVEAGNPRVSRGDIYALARKRGIDIATMPDLKRDNTLWSVIARYMVMLRPKLACCLHFRKSAADEVDMVARWHEVVGTHPAFLASDWKQAKETVAVDDCSAQVKGRSNGR